MTLRPTASGRFAERSERTTTLLFLALGGGLSLLLALLLLRAAVSGGGYLAPVMLLVGLGLLPVLWMKPRSCVYLLFGIALVAEEQALGIAVLDALPLYKDLQTTAGVPGMALNPVELLALIGVAIVLLKAPSLGRPQLGPLIAPFALVMTLITIGVVRGHLAGGDLKIALWGVRGLNLMFLSYFLTTNLVRERGQVRVLFLLMLVGGALKGVVGLWRFVVDLGGDLQRIEAVGDGNAPSALLSHEDSFFFLALLFACILAFLFCLSRRDRALSLVALAIGFVPLLANQRRAAIAAVVLAGIVLVMLLLASGRLRPKKLAQIVVLGGALLVAYGYATWNSTSLVGVPAQAVKSAFVPDRRDASSNGYRDIENLDLRATAKDSHLLGAGLGVPTQQVRPLPDISDIYAWYLYLPHNGLLWLAMTLGLPGLAAFAWLTSAAVVRLGVAFRVSEEPSMAAVYALGLLMVAVYLTFVLLDQGILSQRIGVYMGVQMGLLGLAARRGPAPPDDDAAKVIDPRTKRPTRTAAFRGRTNA